MKGIVISLVILLLGLYLSVAQLRYRLKHPDMTETQLMLRFPDWALWR